MPTIKAQFKKPASFKTTAFRSNTALLKPVLQFLRKAAPLGKEWFLMGNTEAESLLYNAFDEHEDLTSAAEAVLETRFKGESNRYLAVWNGEMGDGDDISITYHFREAEWPDWILEIDFQTKDVAQIGGLDGLKELLRLCAINLKPSYITVARYQYAKRQVFQDRPGVGWMLYLPSILTTQQIPEARALVPVTAKKENGKEVQIGTIIVSVTDEPFDDDNPVHVRISNAIETRLVDQDLLPRFNEI